LVGVAHIPFLSGTPMENEREKRTRPHQFRFSLCSGRNRHLLNGGFRLPWPRATPKPRWASQPNVRSPRPYVRSRSLSFKMAIGRFGADNPAISSAQGRRS
jgi:hypothetical protein